MNDVKFKLEKCFDINLESLDGYGQSNIILGTNEDITELDTTNVTTVTGPAMVKSISSCATAVLKMLTKKSITTYGKNKLIIGSKT